jgi:hypothetical protein
MMPIRLVIGDADVAEVQNAKPLLAIDGLKEKASL